MSSDNCPMIAVSVDPAIIGKDAVLKTCYWFSKDFHHEISAGENDKIQILLFPKRAMGEDAADAAKREFLNALTDFELRCQIESRTAAVRELILAKAFAASGVFEDTQPQPHEAVGASDAEPKSTFPILNSTF